MSVSRFKTICNWCGRVIYPGNDVCLTRGLTLHAECEQDYRHERKLNFGGGEQGQHGLSAGGPVLVTHEPPPPSFSRL
jgi:hypothetical protein